MSNSVVPKFTIIMASMAGNYTMCGKAFDPRLIVAWPSAKMHTGGEQAAKVLLQIEKSYQKQGQKINKNKEEELLKTITDRYDCQTSPYYAASRLWIDAIIDPRDTRKVISMGIEAANNRQLLKLTTQELFKFKKYQSLRNIFI